MKNKICETRMDEFLALDKNERIPVKITLHLLTCKKCRTQVHYLTLAEKYTAEPLQQNIIKEKLSSIPIKPVSMAKWIICGILILILMTSFEFFITKLYETNFVLLFNIIFGLLITIYCTLFVGSNIDFFIKKIDKMPHFEINKGTV